MRKRCAICQFFDGNTDMHYDHGKAMCGLNLNIIIDEENEVCRSFSLDEIYMVDEAMRCCANCEHCGLNENENYICMEHNNELIADERKPLTKEDCPDFMLNDYIDKYAYFDENGYVTEAHE